MIRLSAVGDVVNVLPAVTLLRRALPAAHLAFVVEDRAADVIRGHPLIDEAIVFPRRRWRGMLSRPLEWPVLRREVADYVRRLRGARFDVALDFQGNLKGAGHALASGAPRRIGFARGFDRECNHWFTSEHVTPPADRPHRVEKFASLLGPLGVGAGAGPCEYVLPESQAARAWIEAYLARSGLGRRPGDAGRGDFVVLHPGTSGRGAAKRWPAKRFAELARALAAELGRRSVVTWGPGEEALARTVVRVAGGAAELGPPTGSLLELAELVRHAALFVSADTGPMHLAAACGTPCVALFGPKDPAVYRPWGDGHVVVRARRGGTPRMHDIGVGEVLRAVAACLGGAADPGADPRGGSEPPCAAADGSR